MARQKMQKSPKKRYDLARWFMLLVSLITVLNCVLYLLGDESYYIFGMLFPYMWFELDPVSIAVSALPLAVFVLSWLLSRKKPVWMVIGLVIYILDTLVTVYLLLMTGSFIVDLLVHIIIIVLMAIGIGAGKKLGAARKAAAEGAGPAGDVSDGTEVFTDVSGAEANANEIECTVSVSDNAEKKKLMQSGGVIRFEEDELVIGSAGVAAQLAVGQLAGYQERVRVPYGNVERCVVSGKFAREFALTLADGRVARVSVYKTNIDRLRDLLLSRGIAVEEE